MNSREIAGMLIVKTIRMANNLFQRLVARLGERGADSGEPGKTKKWQRF
jgi:hypothetical protein